MVAIGAFSHIFAVIDIFTGSPIFEATLSDSIEGGCLFTDDFVYVGCYDGKMHCLNAKDGNTVWTYDCADRIKSTPTFCLKETAIVFGSYDRYVHCVDVKVNFF